MPRVEVYGLGASTVGTANIANESVTEPKLANEAVATGKIKLKAVTSATLAVASALPTEPVANNEVKVAAASPAQKVVATYRGDGASVKVKVKHSLETRAVLVSAQKETTKEPKAGILNAVGAGNFTWEAISLSEIEVTFGTAPAAAELVFITVIA